MKVKLSEVAESIDCGTEEMQMYLNRKTGKFEMVHGGLLSAIDDGDDPAPAVEMYGGDESDIAIGKEVAAGEKWLALPSKYDVNDYRIMENFCSSQQDANLQEKLENAIRGSGAFRRFRAAVEYAGILDKWYAFKNEAYLEIAKDWCEENGIEYE